MTVAVPYTDRRIIVTVPARRSMLRSAEKCACIILFVEIQFCRSFSTRKKKNKNKIKTFLITIKRCAHKDSIAVLLLMDLNELFLTGLMPLTIVHVTLITFLFLYLIRYCMARKITILREICMVGVLLK